MTGIHAFPMPNLGAGAALAKPVFIRIPLPDPFGKSIPGFPLQARKRGFLFLAPGEAYFWLYRLDAALP
jgi:hypothetical protein